MPRIFFCRLPLFSFIILAWLPVSFFWALPYAHAHDQFQAGGVSSKSFLLLDPIQDRYDAGNKALVLVDPDGRLSFDDILRHQSAFTPNSKALIEHNGGASRVWVKLYFRRPEAARKAQENWLLEVANSDWRLVDLYAPDPDAHNGYRRITNSTLTSTYPESDCARYFTYGLNSLPGDGGILFLCLKALGPTPFPLTVWRDSAFNKHNLKDFFSFGALYGIMFCMILYNFFLFLSLRNKIYITYVLYMSSYLSYLLLLNGHAVMLAGAAGVHFPRLEWFFLGISIFLVATFGQQFLQTKKNTPRLHHGFNLIGAIGVLVILFGLAGKYNNAAIAATAAGGLGPLFACIAGLARWHQGFSPAKYYLLGTVSLLAGTLVFILWSMGIVSIIIPGYFMLTLGPTADAVLLSFALADSIRSLRQEKLSLAQSKAHYKKISERDGLTGLYNKGSLGPRIQQEIEKASALNRPLSLLILDVDNFKKFNDSYGHPEGDLVLQTLAAVINKEIRENDAAFRYGGEEFVILFSNADMTQALLAAERIRKAFSKQRFTPNGNGEVSVTISLGLTAYCRGESVEGCIRRADQALYAAKHKGKNTVVTAEAHFPQEATSL